MNAPNDERILQLAHLWEEIQISQESLDARRKALAEQIIPLVQEHGTFPRNATRTKSLAADDGTEIRVTVGQESVVRNDVALELRAELREAGLGRIFRKLFQRIEQFTVAANAHELAASKLTPSLLRLFNRAIRNRALSPQVEVRRTGASRTSTGKKEAA